MTELAELKTRLADTADAAGLVDVAYATYDAPVGELLLAATPRGLVKVSFDVEDPDVTLQRLARDVSPRILARPARLDAARRQLDEYFAGERREFGLDSRLAPLLGLPPPRPARDGADPVRRHVHLLEASRPPRAARARTAPPAPRWAPTRSRSSSPATASCAAAGRSAATAAGWT